MTESDKDAIRAKVAVETERMSDALAPMFLGKRCPLKFASDLPIEAQECIGPECSWFLLMAGPNGKVSQGACSVPLLASTCGPIADALVQVAQSSAAPNRVIVPT